jgi:hypothetical protein
MIMSHYMERARGMGAMGKRTLQDLTLMENKLVGKKESSKKKLFSSYLPQQCKTF